MGETAGTQRERHRHPFQFHRQALTPVVDVHDFVLASFFNYSCVKVGYVVCFNERGSQRETKFILLGSWAEKAQESWV